MSLRKSLIKLANRLESAWSKVDLSTAPVTLNAGWYVTEFVVQGVLQHTPRIVIETPNGKQRERVRELVGVHSGRNRMLVYLPDGRLKAYSKSIEFSLLARVPVWEGRARVLLICFRYLLDFFNPFVLFRMLAMQFKNPFDLSTQVLNFYMPPTDLGGYLHEVNKWEKYRPYSNHLAWYYRKVRIAVMIEELEQKLALEEMLIAPDCIFLAKDGPADKDEFDYLIPLAKTEHLRSSAILLLKQAVKKACKRNCPKLVYTDHDYVSNIDHENRLAPAFKPQPGAAYLHCFNYIGPALMFSKSVLGDVPLSELFDAQTRYRLGLTIFQNTADVVHVNEVLFTSDDQAPLATPKPLSSDSHWPDISWQRRETYNVLVADPAWSDKPSVDLIVPTRDGLKVLKPCIESILTRTDYPNFKIFIVDNGSELAETHAFFKTLETDSRVEVIEYPGEFNYSAINNFAATKGSSEFVAMINNDIEVINDDWLTQMMVWAKQAKVGIVGAKLLFGNGLVQHAGVTIGMGNAAGHIHRLEPGDSLGYQNRCVATQNMMAVTAACLVTRRDLFEQLGGLNEKDFKVAYNDIDYCLRVERKGLDVIWTPEAVLYHHESVSRGDDMSDQHIGRYFKELGALQKTWKTKGFVDKYYSKHLRIGDEGVYPRIVTKGEDQLHYLI